MIDTRKDRARFWEIIYDSEQSKVTVGEMRSFLSNFGEDPDPTNIRSHIGTLP